MDNNLITISRRSFIQKSSPASAAVAESTLTCIMARESAYSGQEITWEQIILNPAVRVQISVVAVCLSLFPTASQLTFLAITAAAPTACG